MKATIMFMNSVIRVENFVKRYQKETVIIEKIMIVKRVNLIVGKNGSGKSTLLKAIAGLIKYEGNIDNIHKVSYMSESPVFPADLTVIEFLKTLNNISKTKVSYDEIENLLTLFHLSGKQDELLGNLSKGMKAKVNLIQTLLEKSTIYLLDEPLSGLDKASVLALVEYIEKSDCYFLISTHLSNDFSNIYDEVFYLWSDFLNYILIIYFHGK